MPSSLPSRAGHFITVSCDLLGPGMEACGCKDGLEQAACPCRNVWLNQYSSQLLPIVALVALRVFVGLGDAFLRLVTKPKKDPMQARSQRSHASNWCHACAGRTAAQAIRCLGSVSIRYTGVI